MLESAIFTLIGAGLGWLTSHLYSKGSDKQSAERFAALEAQLQEQTILLTRVANDIRSDHPQIAKNIEEVLARGKVELGVVSEGDNCPACGKQALSFERWGVGPLGVSNAWYTCRNCKHTFQTAESSNEV